jgi:hypothetical protein
MIQQYQSLILTQIQDINVINIVDSCKSIVKINLTKSKDAWTKKFNDLFHINKNATDNSIITDSIDINTFMLILNDIRENDWIMNGSNAYNVPNTTKIIKTFYFQKDYCDEESLAKEKQDKVKEEKLEIYLRKKKYKEELEMQRVLYEAGIERQKNKEEEQSKKSQFENLFGQSKSPVQGVVFVKDTPTSQSNPSERPISLDVIQSVPPPSIHVNTNSIDASSPILIPTRKNSVISSSIISPINIPPPPIRRRISAVTVKTSPSTVVGSTDIQYNSTNASQLIQTPASPVVTSPVIDNSPNAATQRRTLMSARIASLAAAKSARRSIQTSNGPVVTIANFENKIESSIPPPIVSKSIVNNVPPPPVKPITIPSPVAPPPVVVVNNTSSENIKVRSKTIYNIGFQLPPPQNQHKKIENVVETDEVEQNLESKILIRPTISGQSRKPPTKKHFDNDDYKNVNSNVIIPDPTTPDPLLEGLQQIHNINNESPIIIDINNDFLEVYKSPLTSVSKSLQATPMSEVKSKNDDFFRKMKEEENLLKLQKQEEESKMDSVTLQRIKDEEEAKNKHDSSKTNHYAKLGSAFVPSKQSALASPAGRGGGRGRGRGIL